MHVKSFGEHSGTRCRNGVKVLWGHSHLVWVLGVPSIHALVFIQKTSVTGFCFFVILFRNGKREERWEEAKWKMHGLL